MNQELRTLISLQDLEQKIAANQREITEVPARIQELQRELEDLRKSHHERAVHIQELAKRRRAAEGEVDLMRSKLSRLKDQAAAVKTNKEYAAMLHEIQGAEALIRKEEDKILEIMEELEVLEAKAKDAEKYLDSEVVRLQEQIRRLEASVPELETEQAGLNSEKAELEVRIEEVLLDRYRRIAGFRKGVALAEARDELCSACHVRIRPQVYAELRHSENIHTCDSCSRILYLRDS